MKDRSLLEIQDYIRGNRLKHSIGVHMQVQYCARNEEESIVKMMTLAALYHEIGYAKGVARQDSHYSLDGFIYIKERVSPLIAYLILRHTGAEEMIPPRRMEEFKREEIGARRTLVKSGISEAKIEEYVDMLTKADLSTSLLGKSIEPLENLEEVKERVGEFTREYSLMKQEIERLGLNDFKDKKTGIQC